jgi:GntR family transcriptional regulator
MTRSVRYVEIARALRARLVEGEFPAGRLLPSEAELSGEYGVSRVTMRRALEVLREEGVLDARQGFGWFSATALLRQKIGRLGTIEDQMAASGLTPGRRILDFAFVPADGVVKAVLGCEQVLRVRRVSLADNLPFALVTVYCPAEIGQHLSRADVERSPFYELLPGALGDATQTIGAAVIDAADARHLEVPVGSPVLRCERTTRNTDGLPVLYSTHIYPAHRTEFVVDLTRPEPSIAATGLRLVSEP